MASPDEIRVPYGEGSLSAPAPPGVRITVLGDARAQPNDDARAALPPATASLARYLGSQAGQDGGRVGILTVDDTRPSPRAFLPPLLGGIESGGASWEVVIALGRHRPIAPDILERHLGLPGAHQSAWQPDDQPLRFGSTSRGTPIEVHPLVADFDRLLLLAFVEPTYLAGFSGGPKLLVPGCASPTTISYNHSLIFSTGPRAGTLHDNGVGADLREAAERVAPDALTFNLVLDSRGAVRAALAGPWREHRAATHLALQFALTVPRDRFDVVVASPGGAPYDVDMVQTKKALVPATAAVRAGGTVILVGRCQRGWGAVQADREALSPTGDRYIAALAERRAGGHVDADWAAVSPGVMFWHAKRKARLLVVTEMCAELAGTIAEPCASLDEALLLAGANRPGAEVGVLPAGRRAI
jgi:nickel-dependent lactate racemase